MATILAFRPAAPSFSPISLIRVSVGGRVHRASLASWRKYRVERALRSDARLVTVCVNRLNDPTVTLASATCAFCVNATVQDDVTEQFVAEACL
ncbi:MAG: hypothetical protein JWM87_666 [Candidatus Eremiobacteraeota bacterium]|nr:hypothetical protein [Candidatus Eremiobacteraeota bacterium]